MPDFVRWFFVRCAYDGKSATKAGAGEIPRVHNSVQGEKNRMRYRMGAKAVRGLERLWNQNSMGQRI
ncbi:MAG: hypothetical protein HFG66_17240 [Hungatella sp.]|nr:hypothetical protein [Hungatella sp.]